MAFGVYKIENKVNGKVYVGGTVLDFESRWRQHRSQLERRHHANCYLQESWDKYGEDCFSFSVLEIVKDKSAVLGREQKWLNEFLGSSKDVYNIKTSATSPVGGQDYSRRRAILSNEEVAEIRNARHIEKVRLRDLAERYGVSESAISRICNNMRRTKLRKKKHAQAEKKRVEVDKILVRKNFLMDMDDIMKLREKMPSVSEATLVRAGVMAALQLSNEELRDLCVQTIGKPRARKKRVLEQERPDEQKNMDELEQLMQSMEKDAERELEEKRQEIEGFKNRLALGLIDPEIGGLLIALAEGNLERKKKCLNGLETIIMPDM